MDTPTMIAIVIGIVNLAALAVVAWQTWLTRRAVQLAQRTQAIDNLGTASAVIWVQMWLNNWKQDLKQMVADEKQMRAKARARDTTLSKTYGLETPKGLIMKPVYESLPSWLQIITMSAAQYYFDCKGAASALHGDDQELILRLIPQVIGRAKESVSRIDEMLSYIEKIAPEWYLQSPARINDDKFMDR